MGVGDGPSEAVEGEGESGRIRRRPVGRGDPLLPQQTLQASVSSSAYGWVGYRLPWLEFLRVGGGVCCLWRSRLVVVGIGCHASPNVCIVEAVHDAGVTSFVVYRVGGNEGGLVRVRNKGV